MWLLCVKCNIFSFLAIDKEKVLLTHHFGFKFKKPISVPYLESYLTKLPAES